MKKIINNNREISLIVFYNLNISNYNSKYIDTKIEKIHKNIYTILSFLLQ